MRGFTTFVLFLVTLFIQTAGIAGAQPPRLWAYARYEFRSPTDSQLVRLGSFTYSGTRGLALDSTSDFLPFYYLFMYLPNDFSQLNDWFSHRYQPFPIRTVTQFDSFRSWLWDESVESLQPEFTVAKMHTGGRLDSLVVRSTPAAQARAFAYDYDAQGKPVNCRVWAFSSTVNAWQRMDGIRLARNASLQLVESRRDYFNPWNGGAYSETLVGTYYYNAQGQLDSLNTVDSTPSTTRLILREHFHYDALERLSTLGQYSYNSSTSAWMDHGKDSFNYIGISNRYATQYRVPAFVLPPYLDYQYSYDMQGRIIDCVDGDPVHKTFHRNTDGLVTDIRETGTSGTFRTYFYYDSAAAANIVAPVGVGSAASNRTMSIGVFPNPAQNEVFVRSGKELSSYKLYSITGQEVQSGRLTGTEASVSLKMLSPGIYLLHIKSEEGMARNVRVVKI